MLIKFHSQVHKECNHLRHEGLRNKELYYNVFKKIILQVPRGLDPVLEEEVTPTNGGRQANMRRAGDDVGPSRSKCSSSKRKQREATNEMTYSWTIMWHYFDAHPRLQRTFHQLPNDDKRGIIAFVVKSQSPLAD
ncbi:hypothetical protein TIFTF001_009011 [Ficus carica]|uniref:Uncharacterized protein n=1 Tax=Ficus carica TaxID=3494 RepID=A0AA87ZTI8_FICCA|nr:hypothetical protein TIFTF001_009011 [Ficus carica]